MGASGNDPGIWPISCATVGSLLGFLVFNVYPARVFMGDTGSLALGGFVAATAVMLKLPLFIPIVAFIYMIEVISVMLQVCYFKATGGKDYLKWRRSITILNFPDGRKRRLWRFLRSLQQ